MPKKKYYYISYGGKYGVSGGWKIRGTGTFAELFTRKAAEKVAYEDYISKGIAAYVEEL